MADRTGIAMTIVLVGIVIVIGMQVTAVYSAEQDLDEYATAADAYCHQELGPDAKVYNAMVVGYHGGLHCDGPAGEIIHLHDVPREEVMAAANNTK